MAQHTPKPWISTLVMGPVSVPREQRVTPHHYLISEDGRGKPAHLANIAHVIGTGGEAAANAQLIIAAPLMLDALRKVEQTLGQMTNGSMYDDFIAVRAAIAAATGAAS